jgi:hypothetical protein
MQKIRRVDFKFPPHVSPEARDLIKKVRCVAALACALVGLCIVFVGLCSRSPIAARWCPWLFTARSASDLRCLCVDAQEEPCPTTATRRCNGTPLDSDAPEEVDGGADDVHGATTVKCVSSGDSSRLRRYARWCAVRKICNEASMVKRFCSNARQDVAQHNTAERRSSVCEFSRFVSCE